MNYRKQTTHKLFFRKWPFKIRCVCAGSWMIKRLGIARTVEYCLEGTVNRYIHSVKTDKPKLLAFLNAVEPFLDKEIGVRTESGIFGIYCKDKELFNNMCTTLSDWVTDIYVPANDVEQQFMLDFNHRKIICNHLPFKSYQYSVYIKSSMPAQSRESFHKWSLAYDGKIRKPRDSENWLSGKKHWSINPKLYVKDAATLTMVGLFLGNHLSRIEEFVPRTLINTLSKE